MTTEAAADLSTPAISVVVATHNRRDLLPSLFRALAAQRDCEPFEVVVVDDASTDDTWDYLDAQASRSPLTIRPLRVPVNRGPAHARNLGWREARADVVCFTDDDCEPTPTWLHSLTAALHHADIAQGRTQPNPAQRERLGPFSRSMTVPYEEGFYETCNIAYRRAVLEKAEGFDETFLFPFGEDIDLAWRAIEAGARTTFVDDAVVDHVIFPSDFRSRLREVPRLEGTVQALRNHPGLRRKVGWRVFHRPTQRAVLVVAGASLFALARPRRPGSWVVLASATLHYAWMCRRFRPKPPRRYQWIGVVPRGFVIDAYELAVLARASVRHRTLLL